MSLLFQRKREGQLIGRKSQHPSEITYQVSLGLASGGDNDGCQRTFWLTDKSDIDGIEGNLHRLPMIPRAEAVFIGAQMDSSSMVGTEPPSLCQVLVDTIQVQ